ncbi:CD209 antigen-like protein C [Anguilla anguilla]|uniref:CD209 antigen-like protein C n=1 Tax=Anguilla anguilla TaxID=7936 RepID=UPI0015AC5CB6|nr:CD209 antigen-like protein C [Anguilla anguilla]
MDSTAIMDMDHRGSWGSREGDIGMKGTRFYRLIAVSLGLLCVVLLIAIIPLCIHYNKEVNNNRETLMVLKTERDQLQTNYSTVIAERDQLQTNYSTVIAEKDQLQKRLAILEPPCPEDWIEFNSSLYFLSTEQQKTWRHSRSDCIERGADLVIINSRKEQEFLNGLMKTKHFWIGLSDTDEENTWKWVDGTVLTSGFWKTGEPNDADDMEDCATSEPESNPISNWNDMPCSRDRNWVCERSVCH